MSTTFTRWWTNKQNLHRNLIYLTIDQAIGIRKPYMRRPIVGLISNYNHNYLFGSSVEGSSIESFHTAVLSSSHILDDNYLVWVLDIMKHLHKKEWGWFDWAKGAIEKKFKVKFPDNKKHLLYKISDHIISTIHSIRGWSGVCYKMLG